MTQLPVIVIWGERWIADVRLGEVRRPIEDGGDVVKVTGGARDVFPLYLGFKLLAGEGEPGDFGKPDMEPGDLDRVILDAWECEVLGHRAQLAVNGAEPFECTLAEFAETFAEDVAAVAAAAALKPGESCTVDVDSGGGAGPFTVRRVK